MEGDYTDILSLVTKTTSRLMRINTLLFAPSCSALIAQLDRVSVSEAEGRRFDSYWAHQSNQIVNFC